MIDCRTNFLHAIILTYNEEIHIGRCLESIRDICTTITIVDSGSTDRTIEIARGFGAEVVTNPWVNYAVQMNFAIDHLAGRGGWLLCLDADETLPSSSIVHLERSLIDVPSGTDGILMRRRMAFMGQIMRWGGMNSIWQLRVWREGRGRCEVRWMDEHIIVQGKTATCQAVIEDRNQKSIDWWTAKHNLYASREAIDLLSLTRDLRQFRVEPTRPSTPQAARKRMIKDHFYARLPRPLRTSLYFLYRYIIRLGFLDGEAGFYFHVLQGLWYRTLVDAKISDIEDYARATNTSLVEAIKTRTGIDISMSHFRMKKS